MMFLVRIELVWLQLAQPQAVLHRLESLCHPQYSNT